MTFYTELDSLSKLCFPHFARPEICGHFSLDSNREYLSDMSNLMYYYSREGQDRIKLDLNEGIQKVIRKPQNLDEKLDNMLRFILKNYNKLHTLTDNRLQLKIDFVCYRGLLTMIACTPFLSDDWSVLACRWNGVIYLCELKMKQPDYCSPEKLAMFCSWGFKFEQYMLTKRKNTTPDTSVPVNENEEFCCVFKSTLNSHRLLYGAEMDAIESDTEIDPDFSLNDMNFVELKTSRKVQSQQQDRNMRKFKFIKWWCQSYLVGVRKLVLGIRDDKGIVNEIQTYNVHKLPYYAKGLWSAKMCMNFCDKFLDLVQKTIPKSVNDPCKIWQFTKSHQARDLEIKEVGESLRFLPSWYTESYNDNLRVL